MWCLANDRQIPAAIREPMSEWGLCRDEFTDSGGWPHALYVREARRMVSDYVMDRAPLYGQRRRARRGRPGRLRHGLAQHRRIVLNGEVRNEGDVQVTKLDPYPISYQAIVPRRSECENLFVTFCLSASHIAFGSIRMEPVLMLLSPIGGDRGGYRSTRPHRRSRCALRGTST